MMKKAITQGLLNCVQSKCLWGNLSISEARPPMPLCRKVINDITTVIVSTTSICTKSPAVAAHEPPISVIIVTTTPSATISLTISIPNTPLINTDITYNAIPPNTSWEIKGSHVNTCSLTEPYLCAIASIGETILIWRYFGAVKKYAKVNAARLLPNNTLSVELETGITQEIRINELCGVPRDGVSVNLAHLKDGRVLYTEKAENIDKRLIYKDDFEQNLDKWKIEQMPGGTVQIRDGVLEIDDAAGCTVWFKHKLASPVSIEYDVQVVGEGGANDRVSDLNCFWMAQDPENPDDIFAGSEKRGGSFANYNSLKLYYVGYAANDNTTTRFRRYSGDGNKPLLPEHDLDIYRMTGGQKLRIKIVSSGEVNQYWVDGQKIFDYKDQEPYTQGYFGFRTVKNRLRIDNFRVYKINNEN